MNIASKCHSLWQINACVQVILCKLILIIESVDDDAESVDDDAESVDDDAESVDDDAESVDDDADADVMNMFICPAGSGFVWYGGPLLKVFYKSRDCRM